MRAVRLHQFGLKGLSVDQLEPPEPGPGEVLVAMRAASLNYHDLATVMGMANPRMELPRIPLSDGAGEVIATGRGCTALKTGDPVTTVFFQDWLSGRPALEKLGRVTGETVDGAMAEYALFPEQALMPAPDHLDWCQAATLPCAALTAWRALVVDGRAKPGDRVLIQGTGGVSLFALQFARILGLEVFMVSSSREKLERISPLAPDHWISYREEPEWGKVIRRLTGGRGVDLVVEVGGAGTLSQSLRALAVGGHVAMIGVLTGVSASVETARIMALNARVQGLTVGSREDFTAMNRAISQHRLSPVIGETLGFNDLPEALALMQAGKHLGKICLDFSC
jgi:NADPH:quinone reductase-like Zn-dependent oxidoreductase